MEKTALSVAIIGGGFTGLTAGYELLKRGYKVTIIEKEKSWGGLASAFEILPGVFLERFYHHWFTNDNDVLSLCNELGLTAELNFLPSRTSIYFEGRFYPFDGSSALLKFSPLPFWDRLRFGFVSLYLKLADNNPGMEKQTAVAWIKKYYGERAYQIVWEPLLKGKFASDFDKVCLTWFWARIKKRTLKLVYPSGGFQVLIDWLVEKIKEKGGETRSGASVGEVRQTAGDGWQLELDGELLQFDRLICTSSLKTFVKIFPNLPTEYQKTIDSIKYINAQILILVLKKSLTAYYWTNVNEKDFPFLALVEQTNFMKPGEYGGYHLVYLGNYLPDGDPRLVMSSDELFDLYQPYLQKMNPDFERSWLVKAINFVGPFAQPIVDTTYAEKIPPFETPLANLYLATMAQVYPWDRGTNYAVKLARDLVRQHFR